MNERDDETRNRCAFVHDGERCRYVGTFNPGNGKLYCHLHPENADPTLLVAALEQSIQEVGLDFDYSTKATVARVRGRCRAGRPAPIGETPPRQLGRASPLALLEKAAAEKTLAPMTATARRVLSDESDEERRAIRGDW